jgi:hypothetical protein
MSVGQCGVTVGTKIFGQWRGYSRAGRQTYYVLHEVARPCCVVLSISPGKSSVQNISVMVLSAASNK